MKNKISHYYLYLSETKGMMISMENTKTLVKLKKKEQKTIWEQFMESPRNEVFIPEGVPIHGYHFRNQFISKIIKDREIQKLNSENPMMIISQTGSGKSTFVMEKLLPKAQNLGGKLLILVSRTALAFQYKKEAAKIQNLDLLEDLTTKGLGKINCIGDIEIWTYQSVKNRLNNANFNPRDMRIIVFDEAHYFVQDAGFNKFTYEDFTLLLKNLHHCCRVYLTATPDMVANEIIEMEIRHMGMFANPYSLIPTYNMLKFNFDIYEFQADYNYLNPVFFTDDKEIIDLIKNQTGEEKILICIDSKERGRTLLKELDEKIAEYIDAELKNNEQEDVVNEIISKEKFGKKSL